ncbi:transcription termination factor Rho [Chthoniobacter flavus]|uniref:transcription termination factor Rho n=1 Tax=Chthoniobacter flavus TaxID=191863 RepID=UPI001048E285|nr:transcription termination factor Rho [Chthoniobacter flavus]TCO88476.1 transcription termination factor Rho [Chthoniobacter flavus]
MADPADSTPPPEEAVAAAANTPGTAPAAVTAPAAMPAAPVEPPIPVPAQLWIDELHRETLNQLLERATALRFRINPDKTRHHIVFDLLRAYAQRGTELFADGILELAPQGSGFLRWPRYNFRSLPQDVYVPAQVERQFFLRNGNRVAARIRPPRDREKFMTIERVLHIEDIPVDSWKETIEFDRLTALHPTERIILENTRHKSITPRAIDLISPLGRGQRGLIVAPPRTGKTVLLKDIAQSILANSPETHLILLLIDERPEEVTDFRRSVNCEIYSSTFDEGPNRHTQVAEVVSERAKRLVELRKHVVILLDSITRLSRGYNNLQGGKGRTMSGGVDAKALVKPKKFFGAARNTEEGGSLTILATALVETNSRMDDLIFEEYKGTGNMELHLDRSLSDKRVFPAINIINSATRRDELLYHPQEFAKVNVLRRQLAALPPIEATEVLIHALKSTKSNAELLLTGLRG